MLSQLEKEFIFIAEIIIIVFAISYSFGNRLLQINRYKKIVTSQVKDDKELKLIIKVLAKKEAKIYFFFIVLFISILIKILFP